MSYQENRLREIADAIREVKGTNEKIPATNFASEISKLSSVGGEYNIEQTFVDGGSELHITKAGATGKLYYCEAIDYNGDILKSGWYADGQTFELPELPTHDKLVAQEWVATSPIVNNGIVVTSDVSAGVLYGTKSGLTEFDIVLTEQTGLTVAFNITGNKNWGDGNSDNTDSHTYSNYGKYTISCNATEIISNKGESSYQSIFDSYSEEGNRSCVAIRLGSNVTRFGDMAWTTSVQYISVPNTLTTLKGSAYPEILCDSDIKALICPGSVREFAGELRTKKIVLGYGVTKIPVLKRLLNIVIPNTVTTIDKIDTLISTNTLTIPASVVSINTLTNINSDRIEFKDGVLTIGVISNCGAQEIIFSNTITNINSINNTNVREINLPANLVEMCNITNCLWVSKIIISDGISNLDGYTMHQGAYLKEIVYPKNLTTLPSTLTTISVERLDFSKCERVVAPTKTLTIGSMTTEIIVPDNLYEQWIADSKWRLYSSQIKKASEV